MKLSIAQFGCFQSLKSVYYTVSLDLTLVLLLTGSVDKS